MSSKSEDIKQEDNTEIVIVNEELIRDRIYVIRGTQVMLDFDLAALYGYSTKAFNQQVKNNITKFDEDFRFQLTRIELEELVRSKNLTSRDDTMFKGQAGGTRYLPWAFTESGIYMLMTVLKGDLATRQSKALIRTFRAMKDYIVRNESLISQRDYLRISMEITDTQETVQSIRTQLIEQGDRLNDLFDQMQDTVRKSEISPYMLDFGREEVQREYLFLDGQPMKADAAYIGIYSQAKKMIHIVDDYIGSKTLHLLQDVQNGVKVTIFSDNTYNKLKASDYKDFQTEFPNIPVSFIQTLHKAHDRFIVLDYGTKNERIFHCGSSSKDAGRKLTAITEFSEGEVKKSLHDVITNMSANPALILK